MTGAPLALLFAVWALGRVAVFFAAWAPLAAGVVDVAFLPLLALACARPLLAARNRRNYAFVVLVSVLAALNAGSHWAAAHADFILLRNLHRLAIDVVLLVIVLVTGRIVPSFTRNATGVASIGGSPALEWAAFAAVVLVVALDAAASALAGAALPAGVASFVAAVLLAARMFRWGSWQARREPLLAILHFGSAWLPVGFLLRTLALVAPSIPEVAALHALTAGAIGSLTLGMMARVSLGHTGRPLKETPAVRFAFACVVSAGLLRVFASFVSSGSYFALLDAAGVAWSVAFGVFFFAHARMLAAPRVDGR